MAEADEKVCAVCGRRIEWRRKWAKDWAHVKYCSDACRRSKPRRDTPRTDPLENAILTLLRERARGKTICPSEAARRAYGEATWRPHMEEARRAARRLVARGLIEITQQGRAVDPSTAKGPIRLRLCESSSQ
ncbi:MAG: DUF3253 domain-containing protein [Myxococcota bacterium]